jgi:hypothetical protein
MNDTRLIFYHKQNTSARLRFLKFASGSVCAFEPLPALSQIIDDCIDQVRNDILVTHPAQLVRDAGERLGLDVGLMKVEGEYHARVESSEGTVEVYLTEFTTIDPPFEQAKKLNAEFIDLTQARSLPGLELELLRQAYEHVMTG